MLEALLSVVILSVSLVVIIQSMTSSLRASVYSLDYTLSLVLLENKLFELFKAGFIETALSQESSLNLADKTYQCSLATSSLDDEFVKDLIKVNLSLSWESGRKKSVIKTETYLFKPSQ